MRRFLKRHALESLLLLPLVGYLFILTGLPLLSCLVLGFTEGDAGLFPSLANYRLLLRDSQFLLALRNTLWLSGLGISLQLLTGLGVAMVLHHLLRGRGLVRTIVLTPLGVPTIVAGVMFTFVFGSAGYLNEILHRLGAIDTPIDWLGGDWRSLGVILLAELWKVTPLVTLILLAGLESVPESALEAAAVDGAGTWRRFWHITFPLLRPSLITAVVLRGTDALRFFELPLILTGKSAPVLGTFAYSEYYDYYNPYTSAAAANLLLGMVVLCVVSYLLLMTRRQGEAP
jgi:trehalose transport system permease protein